MFRNGNASICDCVSTADAQELSVRSVLTARRTWYRSAVYDYKQSPSLLRMNILHPVRALSEYITGNGQCYTTLSCVVGCRLLVHRRRDGAEMGDWRYDQYVRLHLDQLGHQPHEAVSQGNATLKT